MQQNQILENSFRGGHANGNSLSDQVYDYLADRIIRGEIKYGERLNTKTIAAEMGVSLMPIRDALKRLEMEKVVVIEPRTACYVRVPTKKITLEAIEARRMIEVFAINSVYRTVSPGELKQLSGIVDKMQQLITRTSGKRTHSTVETYIELDRRFHTELCSLAQNDYVNRFYREISIHLNMSFRYGVGVCHGIEATFRDHERILSGLQNNSHDAVSALESHLVQSGRNIQSESTFLMLED